MKVNELTSARLKSICTAIEKFINARTGGVCSIDVYCSKGEDNSDHQPMIEVSGIEVNNKLALNAVYAIYWEKAYSIITWYGQRPERIKNCYVGNVFPDRIAMRTGNWLRFMAEYSEIDEITSQY